MLRRSKCRILGLGWVMVIFATLLAGCGGSSDDEPGASGYSQIIVLGASLTDTGNASILTAATLPGPRYYDGRWSNGPLWIDSLASQLVKPVRPSLAGGTNFAFGGARTCVMPGATASPTDMCGQALSYLAAVQNKADPTALYVVDASSAGNNISTAVSKNLASSVITTDAAADIAAILEALYKAGARRFLVSNVPDVGDTPRFRSKTTAEAAAASSLSIGFNHSLDLVVQAFRAAHSAASVKQVDLYAATKNTVGFSNTTQACFDTDANTLCANPDAYLYWDSFHPTAALGRRWYSVAAAAL
jgi:phospholipase/lecithinase/hemolysin